MVAHKGLHFFLGEQLRLILVGDGEPPIDKLLVDRDLREAHALQQSLEQLLGLAARDFRMAFVGELGEDLVRNQLGLLLHRIGRVFRQLLHLLLGQVTEAVRADDDLVMIDVVVVGDVREVVVH